MEQEPKSKEQAINKLFDEAKRHIRFSCANCAPVGKSELSIVMAYRLERLVSDLEINNILGDLQQSNARRNHQAVFNTICENPNNNDQNRN